MNIVFEGNELVGKSSTIEELSKRLPNYSIVRGSSFEMTKEGKNLFLPYMWELTKGDNQLIDRFSFSNRVYAFAYDGYDRLSDSEHDFLQRELARNGFVVYLYADEDEILRRKSIRGEDDVEESQFKIINLLYQTELTESISDLHIMPINTTKLTVSQVADKIIDHLEFITKWKEMGNMS